MKNKMSKKLCDRCIGAEMCKKETDRLKKCYDIYHSEEKEERG